MAEDVREIRLRVIKYYFGVKGKTALIFIFRGVFWRKIFGR